MWRAEGGGGNKDCFVCRATMYSCSAEKACRLVRQQSRAVELKRFGVCMLNWAILYSC